MASGDRQPLAMKLNRGTKLALGVFLLIALGLVANALTSFSSTPSFETPVPGAASLKEFNTATVVATQTATIAAIVAGSSIPTRMVIFTAQVSLETGDVRSALTQVASIAEQMGGYVAGSSASIFGSSETATMTIKVPQDRFYQAIAAVESLGKLKDKQTQSDDITQEYIDLTARRDNLQTQEKRLQEILSFANNVDDILKVENELARVRGEIESLTGRINYLEKNVALSTIMVTFTKPAETPLPELDWTEPFKTGLAFLYSTVRGLVILAFIAIPFAAIGTLAYFLYRRRRNRREAEVAPRENTKT